MSGSEFPSDLYDTAPPAPAAGRFNAAALKAAVTSVASAILLPLLRRASGDSIGGDTLDDAWRVMTRLQLSNLSCTLGFWDTPEYTTREIVEIYLSSIKQIGSNGADGYVSIKPPALRFDADIAHELAHAAHKAKIRLHCDSHGLNVSDLTFSFVDELLRELPPHLVSVTLPGRWRRSLDDADRLLQRGIGVRIVKGEWPDPHDPARDLRSGFLDLVDRVTVPNCSIAVASHDPPLVVESVRRLKGRGVGCELEFIHGLQSEPLLQAARDNGVAARIYVPFGKGFVPSALRVLRRNPSLMLGVVRHLLQGRAQAAALRP